MQSGSLPRIDHFEIERPLHEGGMGILYLARDTRRGAWVVLKVSRQVKPRADHDRERTAAEQAFYEEALQAGVSPRPRDRPSGYQTKQYPVPTAGSGGDRGRARGFRPRPVSASPSASGPEGWKRGPCSIWLPSKSSRKEGERLARIRGRRIFMPWGWCCIEW